MLTDDETGGQSEINQFFATLAEKYKKHLTELSEKVTQMESFDLLSNISFYNHLHNAKDYSDYREDRMFTISELITLIALKKEYIGTSKITEEEFGEYIKNVQKIGLTLMQFDTMIRFQENDVLDTSSFAGIAFKINNDETTIRNPGIPAHHREIAVELYSPLEDKIKSKFGFSIKESVQLRESIVYLINKKYFSGKDKTLETVINLTSEVLKFRSTRIIPENSILTEKDFHELNKLSRRQIKEAIYNGCFNYFFYKFGDTYTFTEEELSIESGLDKEAVAHFLAQFSCRFGDVNDSDKVIGPSTILKVKPIIKHDDRYLIPSIPLLNWCVEPIIEEYFKFENKIQSKFNIIKHDFLLKKGVAYLKELLKTDMEFLNLYYYPDGKSSRSETDAIIAYDRTLFIVEAKGHRLSKSSKEGKINRTEKHMHEIVEDAYQQGLRTMNYINQYQIAEFIEKSGKKITFKKEDFDSIILVTLVLEPIGNIIPLIRATKEIGYFKKGIFPWIVSIYDLMIIRDHIELPILFIHYIKRREAFLQQKLMNVFDEMDIIADYLQNSLYIADVLHQANENAITHVHFENQTDPINNYYMHKYGLKQDNPPKLKPNLPDLFYCMIKAISASSFTYRGDIMLYLLSISPKNREKLNGNVAKIKKIFAKDKNKHDFSFEVQSDGRLIGFTFITCQYQKMLDADLYHFCNHKMEKSNADIWIGVGDIERTENKFEIVSAFISTWQ